MAFPTIFMGTGGRRASGSSMATPIVSPTEVCVALSVPGPRAISSAVIGGRPSAITGWTGPVLLATNANIGRPPIVTLTKPPRPKPARRGSALTLAVVAFTNAAVASGSSCDTSTRASHVSPERRGVARTWWRLEANSNADVSAATLTATPNIVDRTGTAVRPRPGSSAIRRPAAAAGDDDMRPRVAAKGDVCSCST
jgi:hypothetical protein